jgi:hypothetical protein
MCNENETKIKRRIRMGGYREHEVKIKKENNTRRTK